MLPRSRSPHNVGSHCAFTGTAIASHRDTMATRASCSVQCTPLCDGLGTFNLLCRLHFCCQKCLNARAEQLEENVLKCTICSTSAANPKNDLSFEKQPVPVKRSTSSEPGIWIYVDDSNIWIEVKTLAGKKKKFKTGEDHRIRIDIGKLTDVPYSRVVTPPLLKRNFALKRGGGRNNENCIYLCVVTPPLPTQQYCCHSPVPHVRSLPQGNKRTHLAKITT